MHRAASKGRQRMRRSQAAELCRSRLQPEEEWGEVFILYDCRLRYHDSNFFPLKSFPKVKDKDLPPFPFQFHLPYPIKKWNMKRGYKI